MVQPLHDTAASRRRCPPMPYGPDAARAAPGRYRPVPHWPGSGTPRPLALPPPITAYRFGAFTLDLERGQLLADDGQERPLRPKSFALLRLLVEQAGRLLSQDTIMDALWPNVFVSENNVSQCVREIRAALGPEATPMLRTMHRRGFVFAATVDAVPSRG